MKDFLAELIKKNIHIGVSKGELSVKFPKNKTDNLLLEEIRSRKAEIILYLNKLNEYEFLNIPVLANAMHYALSNAQRRLWILSQFEEGSVAYNMPGQVTLSQDVDVESFKRAISSTIERHEILRTVFKEDETGEIRQWILSKEELNFKIDQQDFRKEKNKEKKIKEYITEDSHKPFNLEKGPLFRAGLLRTGEESYIFYYNMHHIISDGWSMIVLRKDVFSFYEAYTKNTVLSLSELSIQYKDYTAWQSAQLEHESFKAHREFWLNKLHGELPLLDLPASTPRPRLKTYNGYALSTYIDPDTTAKLKKYSEANGGSLFMGLLAAWNVLMYRYTSQTDLIIGTPVAGREHSDLEDQIGFYLNILALRNEIKPEESFNDFYRELKDNTLKSYSHQIYPFDRLVEELDLHRDTSRNAVFDVLFTLQNTAERTQMPEPVTQSLNKKELSLIKDVGLGISKFDIEIEAEETGDCLSLQVVYNPDVYERNMVEGLINHYRQLLQALLENPQEKILQVDYLSEKEKHELFAFNATDADYSKDKTIVDVFEQQAAKTPEGVAVIFENKKLTYSELDELSNQLADYLQKKYKIKPDDLVIIKQKRSEWMIISLLAILKSGAAYVPVDPDYPQERIEYIEKDTASKVCIDEKELALFVKNQKKYSIEKVISAVRLDHLINVIYTSGSTGVPKGVMIQHSNLVAFMENFGSQFGLSKVRKMAGSTNLTFDISSLEIFGALCHGKELVFMSKEELSDPDKFLKKVESSGVDALQLTPSRLSQIYSTGTALPKNISSVLVGGEELSVSLYERLKKEPFQSINVYGPTETTIWSTKLNIRRSKNVSIGTPLLNEEIYILNDGNVMQPMGVNGEICIGGTGLARGYLNQESLTKEKFIKHPFKAGKRLYKTGDLGRWLADGTIDFVGRKDNQVKIRGYRIELGEIEQALLKNEQIKTAVVLVKENQDKEKELVAYFTGTEAHNAGNLWLYLKKILPEHMIPSYFVQLETLPLNASGKTDKKALPEPDGLGILSGAQYVAPRNELENKLVKIWEEILQRRHIGVEDDFFALGGHSLKAVRLSNMYGKIFSVKLSLKDLFSYTTIKSQAELIRSSKKETFIQIAKSAEQQSYPISDAQRRLWVLSQFEEASVAYNMPGKVYLNQQVDVESFKKAIDATIERHQILRTVFKEDGTGQIRQWIKTREDLGFKIEYKDLRNSAHKEESVQQYVQEDSNKAFDLEKGPLLRLGLFQVEDERYVFYYNMHHIISDGWSMGVLSKDVMSYYEGYKAGRDPELKELRIQYKDYSVWQLDQLEEESFKAHRAYWLERLKGELPLLDLPRTKQRPEVRTHAGRTVFTYLNKEVTGRLRDYALGHEGTLFMAVMSVLNCMFYRYTGQQDLILGMQIAGRNHSDLEDQIGFYVNSLALRSSISGEDSFDDVYQKVRERIIEAYSHQLYPFDRLVEELEQSRMTSRSAVFDITVVLQNTAENSSGLSIPESRIDEIVQGERSTSIYDIKFDFQEEGDYLRLTVEYNTDVYEGEMIEGFISHFKSFSALALLRPGSAIGSIEYISKEEKNNLVDGFNQTKVKYEKDKTILDLFNEQVKQHSFSTALVYQDASYSYDELNRRSNQVAHFLLKEAGLKKEEKVGLLLTAGLDTVAAMLGILKAGGTYVPMDPALPEERLSFMAADVAMRVLITQKQFIESANRLQWTLESLENYLCIDSYEVRSELEQQENVMMSQELWDHVGERAEDQITGGGWLSSYTGKAIPAQEMEEYAMNVYLKLKPLLHERTRVLEIGCSSGLTLNKIAPEVAFYYGTDLSPVIIGNTNKLVAEKGLKNIKLKQLAAHDIGQIEEKDFDLVIINSVIQHFHGHNYLLRVIRDSVKLLGKEGRIFIGDIMDINKKKDLVEDLEVFKRENKNKGYTTKTDFSSDLFVSRGYFEDLRAHEKEICDVMISEKICTLENELTKYRYDALLQIDKNKAGKRIKQTARHKWQYSKSDLDSQPKTEPKVEIRPDNLAYIIYTSGTTGNPKGVMVDHYNVVRLFKNEGSLYDFTGKDVWTMFHSYAFDFSVWEMYGALFFGGKLVIVPRLVAQDAGLYLQLLAKEGVTVLNQTPSAFYNLSKEAEQRAKLPLQIRYVIFGGEALSPGKLQYWKNHYPSCKLVNMYGITETTVHTTYKEISGQDIALNRSNIGKAIPTVSCIILDENKNLVPVGIAGELYVGGAGVARGYLNRKELTAERFIDHPFIKGERLYRSGDKVRQLPNGDLEYLGRIDDQVKIRGYRIELGEIEHALLKNDQIEKAIVLAKENRENEKELIAYIRAKTQQNTSDLRQYLKDLLPEYMIPAYFVQLAEIPLTANGKTDKKSLPDPEGLGISSGVEYLAAGNAMEKKLVKIWEEVLQRKSIGIRDDFFDLGGHSLKAVRLSNEYQKTLAVKLSLKDLFSHTTIKSQAELISSSKHTEFIRIKKVARQESYPISDAQNRLWVLSQFDDGSVAYNMPGRIHLNQYINVESFKKAIDATIARHEILRTVFREDGTGQIRQWIKTSEDLGFKIEYKDFRNTVHKEESVQQYVQEDSNKVFDLEKGPLLRAALLQVEDREYVFYYNMHHIIGDGWSMEVLSKDVMSYYEAYKAGREPELKELGIQYKDYSAWQLGQLGEESFKSHRNYWLKTLSGELPLLDLPSAKQRPEIKTHNGRTVVTYINKELTNELKAYSLEREGSLFIGIVSVLKALLFRYTGQQDLILGTSVAGRDHSDLEDQIGFYVNTLPLRTRISGRDSFEKVYQKVQQTVLEAYTHQMYPFDRLVDELEQSRLTSRSAVFDMVVVLQNNGEKISELSILENRIDELMEMENTTCKYDIKFDFQEQGDYLRLLVEYNKDVYEKEIIENVISDFKTFSGLLMSDPTKRIESVYCLLNENEQNPFFFPVKRTAENAAKTLIDLFQDQLKKYQQERKITIEHRSYSYEELDRRSNQVAHFLLEEIGIKKEERVGLLLDRGIDSLVSMLGVLKAGGAYVALDPALSPERLTFMVSDSGMQALVTSKNFIETANRLQWDIESLNNYLCIDSDDARSESGLQKNELMSQELWDHVGDRSEDQITGGGWLSSYTGLAISAEEMEEYAMNAYKKLKPSLHSGMRVLEIGCSSGITLSKIAPEVALYYGTDLSPVIISNTEKLIAEKGLKNVKLKSLAAHELSVLEEGDFDLIIINSVIQAFHGHNYLLKVIRESIGLLKAEGKIFIGDVMDLDKKKDMMDELEAFKKEHEDKDYTTKTEFSSELFISRGYFEDLKLDEEAILDVTISRKIHTIENELTRFRYDALLHINKSQSKKTGKAKKDKLQYRKQRNKWQYDRSQLSSRPQSLPAVSIIAGQLAYVSYVSDAKKDQATAISIEHGEVVSLLESNDSIFDFYHGKAWRSFHSHAFDPFIWQLSKLEQPSFKVQKDYWINALNGELPVLDLPSKKLRPGKKIRKGQGLETSVDRETTASLRKYSEDHGGTLFMGLLAAWNVLMYRYTSQTDILTGTLVSGRMQGDSEDQIGFYINTLALRNEINSEEDFHSFYQRLKENTLKGFAHQEYPLENLLAEMDLQKHKARSAVNAMFSLNVVEKRKNFDPVVKQSLDEDLSHIKVLGSVATKFNINLLIEENGDHLKIKAVYNSDVYEKEMIEGLLRHYRQLLAGLLEHPEEKISRVDYLSSQEKHELLFVLNNTKADYPKDKTIVDLFEEQVKKTPDAAAIVFGNKTTTYRELNEESDRLAYYLQSHYAVQPDDLIGIQLDRSQRMIVCILAVLKAGGAYVPIDSDYPAARKEYIVKDASLKLLITDTNFIHEIDYFEGDVFAVDLGFDSEKYASEKLSKRITVNNLAYVIYTSGSTGKPKGVMVEHGTVVNTLLSQIDFFGVNDKSKGLQFASFSFDASVSETFIILLSGGCLSIIGSQDRSDPKLLAAFINAHQISIATLSPSYLNKINSKELKGLKTLITAGEAAVYEKAVNHLDYGTYYNAYGPTEASICGTIFRLEHKTSLLFNTVPIGKPISNARVYILDYQEKLQPAGAIGEICIAGAGVARGYLNQEELSNQKFIKDPFNTRERLYKTGDLGRWLSDGNIEFIGRRDEQVKVRGYRIELGEIEHALQSYKDIETAVVLAKVNQDHEKELVAYIISREEQNVIGLRSWLQDLLPEYMIPTHYVQVETLPLTANGKLDKGALPSPQGLGLTSGIEYVAPRNEVEEKLVKIWEEVLQRKNIGIKDDFFVLGGNSIKAIKLIAAVQKVLNHKMEIRRIFINPTIDSISLEIENTQWMNENKEKQELQKIII